MSDVAVNNTGDADGSRPFLRWVFVTSMGFLAVAYLLQMASPFRTNVDANRLLYMAIGWQEGVGFYGYGERSFPPGYPVLLGVLDRLGLANSHMFVLTNIGFLGIVVYTLFAARRHMSGLTRVTCLAAGVFTLCSWVIVKHVTLPLTDIPYLGVSCLAILLMWKAEELPELTPGLKRLLMYVACFGLTLAAVLFRIHGIALIPAAVAVVIGRPNKLRGSFQRWSPAMRRAMFAVPFFGLVLSAALLSQLTYARNMIERFRGEVGPIELASTKAGEVGSILLNVPINRVPSGLSVAMIVLGGVWLTWLVIKHAGQFWEWRAFDVYVASYAAVLLLWPYADPRFFLPIIPFIWLLTLRYLGRTAHKSSLLIPMLAVLMLTGGAALFFSTQISFSGERFPDRYSEEYVNHYRSAYGQPLVQDAPPPDPAIVRLIRRFEFADSQAE